MKKKTKFLIIICSFSFALICVITSLVIIILNANSIKCHNFTSGIYNNLIVEINDGKSKGDVKRLSNELNIGANSLNGFYSVVSNQNLEIKSHILSVTMDEKEIENIVGKTISEDKLLAFLISKLNETTRLKVGIDFDYNKDRCFDSIMIVCNFGEGKNIIPHVTIVNNRQIKKNAIDVLDKTLFVAKYSVIGADYLYDNDGNFMSSIFCHEFGHVLGFEDYYRHDKQISPLGGFCLMGEIVSSKPINFSSYLVDEKTDWNKKEKAIKCIKKKQSVELISEKKCRYVIDKNHYLVFQFYNGSDPYNFYKKDGLIIYYVDKKADNSSKGNFNGAPDGVVVLESQSILEKNGVGAYTDNLLRKKDAVIGDLAQNEKSSYTYYYSNENKSGIVVTISDFVLSEDGIKFKLADVIK